MATATINLLLHLQEYFPENPELLNDLLRLIR